MSTASGQGPDLSRMISLIMQNPDLIRQIEALARQDAEAPAEESAESAAKTETAHTKETAVETAAMPLKGSHKRERRTQLLTALRPYISEKRGKTLDTLIGMTDLFDLIGRG